MTNLVLRIFFAIWAAAVWCWGLWVGTVDENWAKGSFLLLVALGTIWFVKESSD